MNTEEIIHFIKDLYHNEKEIQLHKPVFIGNEKKYLNDCIDTSFVSSVGSYVTEFENLITTYTKTVKAVVCVNGTNALFLALKLLGTCADDEVITQSLSFVATVNAISYTGASPVFMDVDTDTLGLSPVKMKSWLEKNAYIKNKKCYDKQNDRKIAACIPMHTFGHPAKISELVSICEEWHIDLIEDAAESIGSFYKNKHTGTFGKIGILSFNGNKPITTGGGGILLFQDKDLGNYAKHITTQAKIPHRWEFYHDAIGYNYRMPNINAALGCAQMENISFILDNKRNTAHAYKAFFANSHIEFIDEPEDCTSNFWLNAILLPSKEEQINFLTRTNDNNIMTRPVWRLLHTLPMYTQCRRASDLETSLFLADRLVNLPSGVRL